MNILAIDYGTKNIGLAWCNTGIGVALPFGAAKNIGEIIKIVSDEKIDKVIIGLPVGINGKENMNTERVRKFGNDIKLATEVEVEFSDERFSSQAADRMGAGVSRDEKSALIILDDWLNAAKK
ncbi:MAG: Holliday junction resolvase RuvX [Candidatus Magasanikbacteria bacterium]|nr:Holliday junction resolvase RuvX [Candidatus Magasanikbacteria bacterium]